MLEVDRLQKTYGAGRGAVQAIRGLSFTVEAGEVVCLVGPSGAGKTTLLRCMSGLMPPSRGEVRLAGRTVDDPPDGMALVFQDYSRSLLPWMTVRNNVQFPLRNKGIDRERRAAAVADALRAVDLDGFDEHYPWQLSGGMQQRVAIARALAYQPRILLMDEPFASVDAQTRADLEDLVLRVRLEFDMTILFVTHDVDEAVYLADRVVVLTPRPAIVEEIVSVDLPRPRDQIETKELPEFAHLRSHVLRSIKRRQRSSSTATESTA